MNITPITIAHTIASYICIDKNETVILVVIITKATKPKQLYDAIIKGKISGYSKIIIIHDSSSSAKAIYK